MEYNRQNKDRKHKQARDVRTEYQDDSQSAVYGPASPVDGRKNKHRFWVGIVALIALGIGIFFGSPGGGLQDVQSNGIGKGIRAGKVLAVTDDEAGLMARDFDIEMKKNTKTSRMLIWDFAAEDGDVVTVKVDGNIVQSNITIMHQPLVLDIPVPSVVEVQGIKDGGGGITYGVKFPGAVKNNAYFNAAPVGSANVYTITGQ